MLVRTSIQLYRDCLRLVQHIAGNSSKGQNIRRVLRMEFKKHKAVNDAEHIEALKANAVRGLSNYLMMEAASKDTRFQDKMRSFVSGQMADMKVDTGAVQTKP